MLGTDSLWCSELVRQHRISSAAGAAADARWIDAGWLAAWADGVEAPPQIDNAPLLCEHGKLDPYKAAGACFISTAAATEPQPCVAHMLVLCLLTRLWC